MKKLSTPLLTVLLVLTTFSLVLYSSCTDLCKNIICQNGGVCKDGKCDCADGFEGLNCETVTDPCEHTICLNGGTCMPDGKCNCPVGYEGTSCELIVRDRFTGIWTVFEDGTASDPRQYEVSVQNATVIANVNVLNFCNQFPGTPVVITITGDSLFIPEQMVGTHTIGGWGILEPGDKTIRLRYKIIDKYGNVDDFGKITGEAALWNK